MSHPHDPPHNIEEIYLQPTVLQFSRIRSLKKPSDVKKASPSLPTACCCLALLLPNARDERAVSSWLRLACETVQYYVSNEMAVCQTYVVGKGVKAPWRIWISQICCAYRYITVTLFTSLDFSRNPVTRANIYRCLLAIDKVEWSKLKFLIYVSPTSDLYDIFIFILVN